VDVWLRVEAAFATHEEQKVNQQLYSRLCEVARQRRYIRYADAATVVGLDMNIPADRDEISRLLDEISMHEFNDGKPLLSAVVIHVQDNIPGNGFFTMAERIGRFDGTDRLQFWLGELRAVHDHWE
jgi:hypothetical protein